MKRGLPVSQHLGAQLVGLPWFAPTGGLVIDDERRLEGGGDEDLVVGGLDEEECVKEVVWKQTKKTIPKNEYKMHDKNSMGKMTVLFFIQKVHW